MNRFRIFALVIVALALNAGCGIKKVPRNIIDAAMEPNLDIVSPVEGEELVVLDNGSIMIETQQERRAPGAIMTGHWRLAEWSSWAFGGRWPATGNHAFQLNIPQGVEGKVELVLRLEEGSRMVQRERHFSIRWPRFNRVESKNSALRVSFPPGEEAHGVRFRLRARPDAEGFFPEQMTFGPTDAKSAQACQGNLKAITIEYSDFQGQPLTATAPARHDCRVTFSFASDRRPFIDRDGKAELQVSVQTARRDEGGHPGSFRLGLLPEQFRAVSIATGHIVKEIKPQTVLHITILEPPPRS